jgi:hypothetical protein
MLLQYASYMTRFSQSGKKTRRVADVITDHGTSLGKLLKRGSFLMQLQHLLSNDLDPGLAAHFQVATVETDRLVLITPSASWATLLRMHASSLLETLHRAGYTEIQSIHVRVAPLVEPPVETRKKRPLSPAARQALDALSHLGEDDEER